MKVTNFRTFMVLILDLIGMVTILFVPFILATVLGSTLYFLGYFVSWLPGGFIFALAGFLAKKEEEKMICYRDMTFCKESNCALFGKCERSFTKKVQEKADRWWEKIEGPPPVCFFAERPECYVKKGEE